MGNKFNVAKKRRVLSQDYTGRKKCKNTNIRCTDSRQHARPFLVWNKANPFFYAFSYTGSGL